VSGHTPWHKIKHKADSRKPLAPARPSVQVLAAAGPASLMLASFSGIYGTTLLTLSTHSLRSASRT